MVTKSRSGTTIYILDASVKQKFSSLTGVGKSTWINAFANYLRFGDLQSATDSEQVREVKLTQNNVYR